MNDFEIGQEVIIKHPVTGERGIVSKIEDYVITVDLNKGDSLDCHKNMVYPIPSAQDIEEATDEFKQDPVRILSMALFEVLQSVKVLENRIVNIENFLSQLTKPKDEK